MTTQQAEVSPDTNLGVVTGVSTVTIPPVGTFAQVPNELKERPFHYVITTPTANTFNYLGMTANFQSNATLPVQTSADLRASSFRANITRAVANNSVGGPYSAGIAQLIRGTLARVGGFHMVMRAAYPFFAADGIFFFGASPAVRAGGAAASAANNTVCFGADTGDANISMLTRDNAGGISKTAFMSKADLLIGDPNTNGACVYDWSITWLPGGALTFSVWDASNGVYKLAPTAIAANLPSTGINLHISGACSCGASGARCDQDFMHFYGFW